MWNCPYSSEYFSNFAEDFKDKDGSPSFSMLSELASCYNITIVGGSIPELDSNRLYNTCCVFGPNGKLLAKHRKVKCRKSASINSNMKDLFCLIFCNLQLHLFDVENPAPGELYFKESNCFTAGSKLTVVDTGMCFYCE